MRRNDPKSMTNSNRPSRIRFASTTPKPSTPNYCFSRRGPYIMPAKPSGVNEGRFFEESPPAGATGSHDTIVDEF